MEYQSLTGSQLLTAFAHKPRVLLYKELEGQSITDILNPYGYALILCLNSANHGHWVCLWRNKYGINFFDSYGNLPDDQLGKHTQSLNGYVKKFRELLLQVSKSEPVFYNQHRLQSKNTSTCGRWCVVRLLFPEISEDRFYDIFHDTCLSYDITMDSIVTDLTRTIILADGVSKDLWERARSAFDRRNL